MTSYFYFSLILGVTTFAVMIVWLITHLIHGNGSSFFEKIIAVILCILLIIVGINNLLNIANVAGDAEFIGILISQHPMYVGWPLLTFLTAFCVALATFLLKPMKVNRWIYLWFPCLMCLYLFLNMMADVMAL